VPSTTCVGAADRPVAVARIEDNCAGFTVGVIIDAVAAPGGTSGTTIDNTVNDTASDVDDSEDESWGVIRGAVVVVEFTSAGMEVSMTLDEVLEDATTVEVGTLCALCVKLSTSAEMLVDETVRVGTLCALRVKLVV